MIGELGVVVVFLIIFNDEYMMLVFGFGVVELLDDEIECVVFVVLEIGCWLIDIVYVYGNEVVVGCVIVVFGVVCEELFVIIKLVIFD